MKLKSKNAELMKIGSLIYLCEGTRSKRQNRGDPEQIELVSSDPFIIKTFINFLRKKIHIEESKLRGRLEIHSDTNEKQAKNYWSKITNIPISQFQKPIISKSKSVRRSLNKLKYGTFVLRYASKPKYELLMSLIENMKKELDKQ